MTNAETATFGGGCFWCLDAVFAHLRGVTSATAGYMGGHTPTPSYDTVCTGRTGHAEVVQVVFDAAVLTYRDLLDIFFAVHDPTTLNRQGHDVGAQYRSVIFYHSPAQKAEANAVMAAFTPGTRFAAPVVTEVSPAQTFHRAEASHQDYFANNPAQPYCAALIAPKLAMVSREFAHHMKR